MVGVQAAGGGPACRALTPTRSRSEWDCNARTDSRTARQHCSRVTATRSGRSMGAGVSHGRRGYPGRTAALGRMRTMIGEADPDFWRTRRVLVTGGRGFLGRAVLDRLSTRDPGAVIAPSSTDYDL